MTYSDLNTRHVRILLVLARAPSHGYAISQEIEDVTAGEVVLRPGSLYRALHQLLERKMILERHDPHGDPRRRLYELTPKGRRALAAELSRMADLVTEGRRMGVTVPQGWGK